MMPRRVQLRRTRGWRLPPNTVVVARPGRWGNPFRVGDWCKATGEKAARPGEAGFVCIEDPAMAVAWFERWIKRRRPDLCALRGKNLACWCAPGRPCHGDVLLRLARKTPTRST